MCLQVFLFTMLPIAFQDMSYSFAKDRIDAPDAYLLLISKTCITERIERPLCSPFMAGDTRLPLFVASCMFSF